MTKYELAQYLRELLDGDLVDLIENILALADHLEDEEETYGYRAKRIDNGEWVEGCILVLDGDDFRMATSCIGGTDSHLLEVCAYEIDPDTIEEIFE